MSDHWVVTENYDHAGPLPTEPNPADMGAGEQGQVDRPRRRTPSWVPILIGALAFLLVLAGLGLISGDWVLRNAEMNSLVSSVEQSESAMQQTQDEIGAVMDATAGMTTITPEQRADLAAALTAAAVAGEKRIAAAGDKVSAVRVAAWHGDIAAAKQAYVTHNQAWQDYMSAGAADPKALLADTPAVNDSFAAAEPLMKKAVPEPDLFDLVKRVALIFTSGQDEPTGPTQQASLRQ